MRELYLIRHTRPDVAPGTCYGGLDLDVADGFDGDANHILRCLPPLELVVASPLLRARRLGGFLAQAQDRELRLDARLMEKHFGAWEGKSWDDVPRVEIDTWAADVMGYAPPGGESAQDVMRRVRDFMRELARLPQRRIAVVAHGGSIRAMLAQVAGVPLAHTLDWEMEYGAVICVRP